MNREQPAHCNPNPIGPVLPALSENAHLGPVRPPPRPARTKIDFGIWYAVEGENNLHMGEFVEGLLSNPEQIWMSPAQSAKLLLPTRHQEARELGCGQYLQE